jgi:hypothetical protein
VRLSRAATMPRRRNSPRPAVKSASGFLQWLRGRPCACGGRNPDCGGKMQAAHGPDKATKGMGTKCRDSAAIPLTENCHREQHALGWITFTALYLIEDPLTLAASYWQAWPGRVKWEAKNG